MDCDSPLLCDLWRLTRNTVELTTQDLYVDSQSRERGAYEGDALINQLAAYSFESDRRHSAFFTGIPVCPSHMALPQYILWITEAAYEDYMATGDDSSLVRWYPILRGKTFSGGRLRTPTRDFCIPAMPGEQGRTRYWSIWPPSERDADTT